MVLNVPTTRVADVAASDYLAALDFLFRMKSEKKVNEANIELFTLLYGESCYEVIHKQGFFNSESN